MELLSSSIISEEECQIQHLEKEQQVLKRNLDALLLSESVLTGVYSGVSAVSTKYLVEVLRETTDMT